MPPTKVHHEIHRREVDFDSRSVDDRVWNGLDFDRCRSLRRLIRPLLRVGRRLFDLLLRPAHGRVRSVWLRHELLWPGRLERLFHLRPGLLSLRLNMFSLRIDMFSLRIDMLSLWRRCLRALRLGKLRGDSPFNARAGSERAVEGEKEDLRRSARPWRHRQWSGGTRAHRTDEF